MSKTQKENPMAKSGKHTAVYCRVANAMCDDRFSVIDTQKKHVTKFAEQNGYADFVCYFDEGYSGLNLNRPGFLQMTEDIQAGKIAAVITHNVSRIGRNFVEVLNWLEWLDENCIEFVTTDGFQRNDTIFSVDFQKALRNFKGRQKRLRAECHG